MLSSIDFQLFTTLNNIAGNFAILDLLGIFLANYLIWLLFFIILILGFLPPSRRGEILSEANALRSILATVLGGTSTIILGQFIHRARPFAVHEVNLLIAQPLISVSFPSLHTTLAFTSGCTLFLFNKRVGLWFLFAALLIGLARVYVGVHYPSDIIFGAIIGCLASFIIKSLAHRRAKAHMQKN